MHVLQYDKNLKYISIIIYDVNRMTFVSKQVKMYHIVLYLKL